VNREDLRRRTKEFAIRIIELVASLPKNKITDVVGYQLLKSGTSIGANYREACRARSRADFISKIGIVEQEADETLYWLELLAEMDFVPHNTLESLQTECNELLSIFVATGKSTKSPRPQDSST
jgi:four helix bundle protein